MTEAAEAENNHILLPPDELLAEMPLHSLTLEFGFDGLARRFEIEKAKLPEEGQALVSQAYEMAMRVHAADVRKSGEPTHNHLLRVAIRLMHHYGVSDPTVVAAALLHDSVEDHSDLVVGRENATQVESLDFLAANLDAEVADLVQAVTNPEYDPSRDKLEQYQEHVAELLKSGDTRAKIIKVSDFTDNALGLKYLIKDDHNLPETVTYRARRYLPLIDEFEKAFSADDTGLSNAVREHILRQLSDTRALLNSLSI